jgi:hypothetical protein
MQWASSTATKLGWHAASLARKLSLPSPTSRSGDTYSRRYRPSRNPARTDAFSSEDNELLYNPAATPLPTSVST